MQLNKGIPVNVAGLNGTIFGGPYKQFEAYTRRLRGIKMAVEIHHPYDFKVDTEDFSIPKQEAMQQGIDFAIRTLKEGSDIYVGCMGGTGRTGLFMGCMAKAMADYLRKNDPDNLPPELKDPVKFVRLHYKAHAIETEGQQAFVRNYDSTPNVALMELLNAPKVVVKEKEVVKEVVKEVFLSPFDYLSRMLAAFIPK